MRSEVLAPAWSSRRATDALRDVTSRSCCRVAATACGRRWRRVREAQVCVCGGQGRQGGVCAVGKAKGGVFWAREVCVVVVVGGGGKLIS
jgi:hypothetical protein